GHPFIALALEQHVADAAAGGLGEVEAVFEAGDLGKAAGAVLDIADAVFKRLDDIGAADLHGGQRVGEGQHGEYVAHGDLTRIDGGADAAAVLEGDGGALVGDAVQNGVGQQVPHRTFHGPADFARAFELVGGRADDGAG